MAGSNIEFDLSDQVPPDAPGILEIGFSCPETYNASAVLFDNIEKGRAENLAVTGPSGSKTYAELCADAAKFGNGLKGLGLEVGDRVLCFLDDTPAYPAVIFGAIRAGLVPVLINTLTPSDLLQYYLADSASKVAICDAAFVDRFNDVGCTGTKLKTLIVVNGKPSSNCPVKILAAADWLPKQSEQLKVAETHRNDMAFWMYSSGSTGRPKGIVHLQHDLAYTNLAYAENILKLSEDDICFSIPKIFFAYGFGNSVTFPFMAGATALLLAGQPKPDGIFEAIAEYSPTVFFGLPTLYTALVKAAGTEEVDLSSLRLCVSAAEILSEEIFNGWKSLSGLEIVEGLGSTEVLHMYLSNTGTVKKLAAAGMPVPGYECVLRDAEGKVVAEGDEGVLWVRGDSNSPGYWNQPEKTSETMREKGWLYTGDKFRRDADGFHFFLGRADDLVKVSGQWVYPMEVEVCLNEHPAVRECAVLAMQLEDKRTILEAFVSLNDKSAAGMDTTKTLQEYVKATLLPYKYPRVVTYVDDMPKTGTGKIDRQGLLSMKQH